MQPFHCLLCLPLSVSWTPSCSVCLTRVACGTIASWGGTGRRSLPKRTPSWRKVTSPSPPMPLLPHPLLYLFLSSSPLPRGSLCSCAAFSQVLTGLWDESEAESVVNPRQLYNVFKEAVPYFSGYRWACLWNNSPKAYNRNILLKKYPILCDWKHLFLLFIHIVRQGELLFMKIISRNWQNWSYNFKKAPWNFWKKWIPR